MTQWKGFVSHIVYRNEENGYTVFEMTLTDAEKEGTPEKKGPLKKEGALEKKGTAGRGGTAGRRGSAGKGSSGTDPAADPDGEETEYGRTVACVGNILSITVGESCEVSGETVTHPVYGDQLKVLSYRVLTPESAEAVYRYLAAGSIKGIRKGMAGKIVKRFGADALRIMEEEPEKLVEIKGISRRIAREIGAQMEEKKDLRDAMVFLQQYGIGNTHAARIWQAYGPGLYTIMKTNPYRLAEDIRGIGFATADEIARRIGIRADSEFRIRSGLLYTLAAALGEGHSYLPEDMLVERTCTLLRLPPEEVLLQMENLTVEHRLRVRRKAPVLPPEDLPARDGGSQADLYAPPGYLSNMASPPLAGGSRADPFAPPGSPDPYAPPGPAVEVYLSGVYRREQEIARMLLDLDAQVQRMSRDPGTRERLAQRITRLEKEEKITLDPLQRQAVLEAGLNAVLLITGGPGTGKTTTINTIIRFFEQEDLEVLLAAPTGRAARRMSEASGRPAMTIHRLLGVQAAGDGDDGDLFKDSGGFLTDSLSGGADTGFFSGKGEDGDDFSGSGKNGKRRYSYFEHKEDNPLEADVVIIDEMSMVDMNLFHALLRAVPVGARLVLVGDVNQLPSVGPGCVLQDLIETDAFHTIRLQHIFRQASESDIVMNAHRILEGASLPMDNRSRDFFFLERDQVPVIYKHTVQLMQQMLPGYVGCRTEDIQVLTPMRRGSLGVEQLNAVLQSVLNPPAEGRREYTRQETVFREGDKVMQTRNNYRIAWEVRGNFGMPVEQGTGIFNGDFGRIEQIDPQRKVMTVCFDDARTVEYPFQALEDLEPAYAVTVHKAQGSEYPAVILPLLDGPSGLFNRNLLYTAVTRARNCVVIIGSRRAVDRMIANTRRTRRFTGLRDRITEMRMQ